MQLNLQDTRVALAISFCSAKNDPFGNLPRWIPKNVSRVPNTALSCSLWVARPWPSKSFKRMAPTAVPQDPITCALLDEWHQQLFMRHELRSNLVAAIAPCFSDVCGYSCKDVQTPRLTVRSCSPLHCHCLTDGHRHQKKESSILGFWTKVLEIAVPKDLPLSSWM